MEGRQGRTFYTFAITVSISALGRLFGFPTLMSLWQPSQPAVLLAHVTPLKNISWKRLSPPSKPTPLIRTKEKIPHKMTAFFTATDITKARPDGSALFKNVSIELGRGDVLTLRGPSGVGQVSQTRFPSTLTHYRSNNNTLLCSKTTLLKCLAELIPYESGTSLLDGKKVTDMGVPVWRSRIMYVPQRPSAHAGTPLDLFRQASKYASQAKKAHLGNPVSNISVPIFKSNELIIG